MSILPSSILKRVPEPVPIFVLRTKAEDSMEFYGFHDFFCRTFDGDDEDPGSDEIRAIPFTRMNSCPGGCGFTSYQGDIVIVGGTLFSLHLRSRLMRERDLMNRSIRERERMNGIKAHTTKKMSYEEILEMINGDYPSAMLPNRGFSALLGSFSNRFATFSVQDLVNNKQLKVNPTDSPIDVGDLCFPIDSPYWHLKSSLDKGRSDFHVHVLHGKLFVVGGDWQDDFSIEVYDNDGWRPAVISPPVKDCAVFLSVALPDGILIGSSESGHFIYLQLQPNLFDFISTSLPDVYCPEDLIFASIQTGILVREDIVVWLNGSQDKHIVGLQFGLHMNEMQHFFIDIIGDNILIPDNVDMEYCTNLYHAKLIGLGKGRIAMIYTGTERRTEVDEEGIHHNLCDYRCVTFEIICNRSSSYQYVPYPGIQLKTRIISNRKCYAPFNMYIETALVMDVCFPVENLSLSSSRERLGLQAILH